MLKIFSQKRELFGGYQYLFLWKWSYTLYIPPSESLFSSMRGALYSEEATKLSLVFSFRYSFVTVLLAVKAVTSAMLKIFLQEHFLYYNFACFACKGWSVSEMLPYKFHRVFLFHFNHGWYAIDWTHYFNKLLISMKSDSKLIWFSYLV